MAKILIISDDTKYSDELKLTLSSWRIENTELKSATFQEGRAIKGDCDILILDYSKSKTLILDEVRTLKKRMNAIGLIVGIDIRHLIDSRSLFELPNTQVYINNTHNFENLREFVNQILGFIEHSNLHISQISKLKTIDPKIFEPYIIKSDAIFEILKEAVCAFNSEENVLLLGDTGVGKEIFAEIIHKNSLRREKRMVTVNSSSFVKETAYSELFGHVKGAFTEAKVNKDGFFTEANGSTIFLDELADMPEDTLPELLRVFNAEGTKREFYKKGSTAITESDVRIIAATNRIKDENDLGGFRKDLFYRFTWRITIPPLKERKEEIPFFIDYFLEKNSKNKKRIIRMSDEAISILMEYNHPGNIRELKNIVSRACSRCQDNIIEVSDLDKDLQRLGLV